MRFADFKGEVRRLAGELSRNALLSRQDLDAVEAVIAAALGREVCNDPVFFAAFLRECLRPAHYPVERTKPVAGDDAGAIRFAALLKALSVDAPVVPQPAAIDLARAADVLLQRTDAYPPAAGFDLGQAARVQSSLGRKGRLLAAVARFRQPAVILELGTAYGMSAGFLSRAAPGAQILTFEPQTFAATVAREQLAALGADRVEVIEAPSASAGETLAARGLTIDLLFHDAVHTGEAYVEDFKVCEPHLARDAFVVYDDIHWTHPAGHDVRTHEGWTEVVRHPRVRAAAEVDGALGVALIS
jgi:predicted O-methyltransferase YrrM